MDWIKVTVYTTTEGIEPVSGRMMQLGITGLVIEDENEFNDFLEETKDAWDYVDENLIQKMSGETRVIAYISDDVSGRELLSAIKSTMCELSDMDTDKKFGRLTVELEGTKTEDWANAWKQYFHAMEIGEKILVKPQWEELREPTDRVVFNINPGMSFGTGSHETTQLCLTQLEKYITPDCCMLDLGCGSGILSVVSLLLGAKEAVAVDIDPNCIDTAYENSDMNGIDRDRYMVISGNVLTDPDVKEIISKHKYEVVAANIVADVIIGLAPAARLYMKEGGVFITSGIIDGRQEEVKSALINEGFEVVAMDRRKDWWSIVCK